MNRLLPLLLSSILFLSCNNTGTTEGPPKTAASETPEYFNLRPEIEKAYGYSHAVKIGNDTKISGAVKNNSQQAAGWA